MVTLKHIAKEADVSISTVSRVVNNHRYVKKPTREKVLNAIQKLSYYPDGIAKKLKQGKSRTIGFILPDISNSFFGMLTLGIERVLRKNNYRLILCNTNGRYDLERESLTLLLSEKVEGIILATVGTTGELVKKIIHYHKIPVIVVDNKVKNLRTDVVLHDNIDGAQQLTSHLIAHGHKRIAFVGGPVDETSGGERLKGYKKALMKNGLPILNNLIRIGKWRKDSGFRLTKELLKLAEGPTGIVASNTSIALGVLLALQQEDLKVPRDIGLVSFDDLEFVSVLDPPLTTLKSVDTKIGETSANLLLKRIKNRNQEEIKEIYLPMELMIRSSCGCKGFGNSIDQIQGSLGKSIDIMNKKGEAIAGHSR